MKSTANFINDVVCTYKSKLNQMGIAEFNQKTNCIHKYEVVWKF